MCDDTNYPDDSWVVALDHQNGKIDVCVVYPTREQCENHVTRVSPKSLRRHTIVCSLQEARERGFRYTEPYNPHRN